MTTPVQAVAGRSCGDCYLCCFLPEIDEFSKPANVPCSHCGTASGCAIYAERPQTCRDFFCAWISDARIGPEWEPAICHMMVYAQGQQITVLVDPGYPDAWTCEPYHRQLRQWAAEVAPSGGYIIVYVGDDPVKIEAEAEEGADVPRLATGIWAGGS